MRPSLILLVAALALVQCSNAVADPKRAKEAPVKASTQGVGRLPSHIALQNVQERPSLDKDFYNSAGFGRFETKADGPVPDSHASWPSLEQEREEAMNSHGWFDPRVSNGWVSKAADKVEKPKPSADANKPAAPLDQEFYDAAGFPKPQPQHKPEDAAGKKASDIPSLEEQREEVFNKAGWFDPRYSRRWEATKAMAGKPKKVST